MDKYMILHGHDREGDDREVQGDVDTCYPWENLPHDVVKLIFQKLDFLDLLYLSSSCDSWKKVCSDAEAFSVLDFRNWTRISQLVRDNFLKLGWSSVTEDQIFDSVLKFAVKRSLGYQTTVIFPNHQRVPHAICYVKQWCPNIKSFYLGDGGEYWHGRKLDSNVVEDQFLVVSIVGRGDL